MKKIADQIYEREYLTAKGESRKKYYGIFTDWKGVRRTFPLGSNLKAAKTRLNIKLGENARQVDFDAEKKQKAEEQSGLRFSEWSQTYLEKLIDPEARSKKWQGYIVQSLGKHFNEMYLDEIDEEAIDTYRNQRQRQPITTHKRPIKGTKVSYATVNRELAILRRLLRLAKRHKKIKGVPEFELKSEKPLARNRVLSAVEYQALLESSPRYAQRVFIGLNETAMRVNELLKLTWDRVNEAEGFIRLRAEDVKEKRARVIPISAEVRSVLAELKAEQRSAKVKDFGGRVFTRNGAAIKNIRKPFEAARNASGLNDIHLHDFCHTCITAWEMNGLPQGVIMAASGHHSREMHNRYVNPTEQHIKEAFKNCERIVNKESGVDDAAVVTA